MRSRRRAGAELAGGLALLLTVAGPVRANNLQVTNVTVSARDNQTALVQFDISWQTSWRYTNINHDAAWVFFKTQPLGGNWQHVRLEGTGTNPPSYSTGTGSSVEMVVPDDRMGVLVRRAGEGAGPVAVTNMQAVWNLRDSGLTKNAHVLMQAFAVEMVYVAEGSFYAGDGTNDAWQFCIGGGGSSPYQVTNETAITCADTAGNLWAPGGSWSMVTGTIPAEYPKGYGAFYCMKYPVTEGQWVAFFNTLTDLQKGARDITAGMNDGKGTDAVKSRNTVSWTDVLSPATTVAPDRACSYLGWPDGCAFMAWAGLRPMTELEFEKACRGPLAPVADEYAWGSTNLVNLTGVTGTDGSGTETPSPATANCLVSGGLAGPARVGISATATSTREAAGASYWGIMGLSGGLWELTVTAGIASGRSYAGTYGNGVLSDIGNATNADWYATTAANVRFRGGSYNYASTSARLSARNAHPNSYYSRRSWNGYGVGCRAVRSAPSGVGP